MPTLPPYIIEPIWDQFEALLPPRKVDVHPLGCHRHRVPDRLVFDKLVQVLVFGCAYERIADESCSATTLRRRRDEWIDSGAMEKLRRMVFEAYDQMMGLDLSEVAVDCCITKAPCGGERAGRSPVDRGKQGIKRSTVVDANGIPLGAITAPANRHDSPLLGETLDTLEVVGSLPDQMSVYLDCGYDSQTTRETLKFRGLEPMISEKGKTGSASGNKALGGGEDQLLAKRPQEARVVYGEGRTGHRILGRLLGCGYHRWQANPRSLEPLPLGASAPSQAVRTHLLGKALNNI